MRQLRREGWMHNRARLVVGSFLTKDLGIDWRWGERWFMRLLVDGDEANNNGNWQWIASVGTDPAAGLPADLQPGPPMERYDPDGRLRAPLRARAARTCPTSTCAEPWTMPEEVQRAGRLRDRRATTRSRSSTTREARARGARALPGLSVSAQVGMGSGGG